MNKIDKVFFPVVSILVVVMAVYTIQSDIERQKENTNQLKLLDDYLRVENMTSCRELENYMATPPAYYRDMAWTMFTEKPCLLFLSGDKLIYIEEMTCEMLKHNLMQDVKPEQTDDEISYRKAEMNEYSARDCQ